MRGAILGLAIFGALAGGFLGMRWLGDADKVREAAKLVEDLGLSDNPEVKASLAKASSLVTAAYLLIVGALVAVPAAVVGLKKPEYTKVAGAVLIACAAVPAIFAMKSLVFTFFLVIAGGLCLKRAAGPMTKVSRYPQPLSSAA